MKKSDLCAIIWLGVTDMSNICKFVESGECETLRVDKFIFETDAQVLSQPLTLTANRMMLVKAGSGKFVADRMSITFEAGVLMFAFAGEQVAAQCDTGTEIMYIDFCGDRAKTLLDRFGINKAGRRYDGFDGMVPLWHRALARSAEDTLDITAESMLLYAFSIVPDIGCEKKSTVRTMISLCEKKFTDSDFGLDYLADKLGYSVKYLSHLFKAQVNIGFVEYLRDMRIRYAVTLLEHGIDSVKNVALLSGFSDPLYFSTVFKKEIGVSPKTYAATHKK